MQTLKSMISVRTIVVIIALLGLIWWLDQEDGPPIPAMPNTQSLPCDSSNKDCNYRVIIDLSLYEASKQYQTILEAHFWLKRDEVEGCKSMIYQRYTLRKTDQPLIVWFYTQTPTQTIIDASYNGLIPSAIDCE